MEETADDADYADREVELLFEFACPAETLRRQVGRSTFAAASMKRILITGASRGIGRAITERLADPDVELLLHGRDTVALAEVCRSVKPRCAALVKLVH